MKFDRCRKIVATITFLPSISRRGPRGQIRLSLEHLQHPVGDQEPADDVDRAERDRDHQQHVLQHAGGLVHQQQASENHDPMDRVGARHQRRVQRVRDLRDDLEPDERGQHEDRDLGDEGHLSVLLRIRTWPSVAASAAALAASWTISPSRVMQAPAITSSSKSSDS